MKFFFIALLIINIVVFWFGIQAYFNGIAYEAVKNWKKLK